MLGPLNADPELYARRDPSSKGPTCGCSPSLELREDPLLTIDIGTHQGLFHLCWGQGEANQEQDVLEAPRIHLARAVEDLKVAAEGCQGAQGDQVSLSCVSSF